MNEQESIEYLEKFAKDQKKRLDNIGDSIDSIQQITDNIIDLTDKMRLLSHQMDVLSNPLLLKDIYDLSHEEWMGLTTEEMIDLVEEIKDVPEKTQT